MLKLTLNGSDIQVIAAYELKSQRVISAVSKKMEYLMVRLQQKIVTQKLSGQILNRRTGRLAASITNPQVRLEGTNVVGSLEWGGGDAWYGRVHELGGKSTYAINPLGVKGTRSHSKGGKRRFGSNILSNFNTRGPNDRPFLSAVGVFHPPAKKRSFIASSLEEMREEIREELKTTLMGSFK